MLLGLIRRAIGGSSRRTSNCVVDVTAIPVPSAIDCGIASGFMYPARDESGDLIWPDDPDEVPAWRVERETWASWAGVSLPNYRTRREAELAADMAMSDCNEFDAPDNLAPAMPADESARLFLESIQDDDLVGEFSAAEIATMYASFCASRRVIQTGVDLVKAELALMPGVHREKIDRRVNGKRERSVRWIIEPANLRMLVDDEQIRMAA